MDISILICTFNGAPRIGAVLNALEGQVITSEAQWEVIVIDNNSIDCTSDVVELYKKGHVLGSRLKYIVQKRQGQAFARQLGVETASGRILAFLDDDNVPDQNWIAAVLDFEKSHVSVGAFGGQVHLALEIPEPQYFDVLIKSLLTAVERGDKPFMYTRQNKMLPCGAGLVVRKQVWLDYVPAKLFFSGRIGSSGMAYEDVEALLYIQNAGWEIWYCPTMHLNHQIPETRFQLDFLIRLAEGVGHGRHQIRKLRLKKWQHPLLPLMFFGDIIKYAKFKIQNRKSCKENINLMLYDVWLRSTIESPYFLWRNRKEMSQA
jgi:glycosyltransferase involved in cell wall biosynthesis